MASDGPSPNVVRSLFHEGVQAFAGYGQRAADESALDRPACGRWTVADLVRHELDVIGWYHNWLDRALAGDPSPAFNVDELDDRTDAGVRTLATLDPNESPRRSSCPNRSAT